MHDPLVDSEGFPLPAIDIYKIRHSRHRIICEYIGANENAISLSIKLKRHF